MVMVRFYYLYAVRKSMEYFLGTRIISTYPKKQKNYIISVIMEFHYILNSYDSDVTTQSVHVKF